MAYATIEYNNYARELTVHFRNLQYAGRAYDKFELYLDGTHMYPDADSSNPDNEANVVFNVRNAQEGYYTATVYAVWRGDSYPVPIQGGARVRVTGGGGYNPDPDPPRRVYQMTQIKITNIHYAESNHFEFEYACNGYGEMDVISVTQKHDHLAHIKVFDYDIGNDGWYHGTLEYHDWGINLDKLGALPFGTVQMVGEHNHNVGYAPDSKPILCVSTQDYTVYNGMYATTISFDKYNHRASVASFSSLTREWIRLCNVFYYIESTAFKNLTSVDRFRQFIPSGREILTAQQYNGLVNSARSCANRIGVPADFPTARSGQIIPSTFIYDLGTIANRCIQVQKANANNIRD